MIKNRLEWWKNEVLAHPFIYIFLAIILLSALFLRVYRVTDLLGFYYDQGRDALVIWNLWHSGKPFLIGPVTGLTGIFLGPFYYYLIAPFYLLGRGNPAYPAVFLAFLSVCALGVVYYLGWEMHSRLAGLIATAIGAFSYYVVLASRWLSNPTPILLTSVLLLLAFWKILTSKGKYESRNWWLAVALLVGLSMQFESASAIFYFPITVVFTFWQWKKFPPKRQFLLSLLLFTLTLLPQIIFNYRHDNILFNNFSNLFYKERSFKPVTAFIWQERTNYFWSVFSTKIMPGKSTYAAFYTLLSFSLLLYFRSKLTDRRTLLLFALFLIIPMIGYLLFQGNYGNIYDYYMTGYYLPMILLFSLGLANLWYSALGKVTLVFFFVLFFQINLVPLRNYLQNGYSIRMETQLASVNWIYNSAKVNGVKEYNVDVYIPPVIPYPYDYLFLWQGNMKCSDNTCGLVTDRRLPDVYLLYEEDNENPVRFQSFLGRYKDTTEVIEQKKFEGITVERRKRIL